MMLKHQFSGPSGELGPALQGKQQRRTSQSFLRLQASRCLRAVGCAVDYSLAIRMKSKMQSAADAASVGAISQSSPGYATAEAMTGNGSVGTGVTDASNIFMGNLCGPHPGGCTNVTGYSNLTLHPLLPKRVQRCRRLCTFTAQVPATFLK